MTTELEAMQAKIKALEAQVAETEHQRKAAEERAVSSATRAAVIAELGRAGVSEGMREPLFAYLNQEGLVGFEDGRAHYRGKGFPEELGRGIKSYLADNPGVLGGQAASARPAAATPTTSGGDVDWDALADNVDLTKLADVD